MKKLFIVPLVLVITLSLFSVKAFSQKTAAPAETKSKVVIITDGDFDKTIKKGVTMVDFWATWCGPCRRQGPIVEEIANENTDKKVKICKMDVDKNKATSNTFGIRNIPTIIIFKDGKEVKRLVGLQDKSLLLTELKNVK